MSTFVQSFVDFEAKRCLNLVTVRVTCMREKKMIQHMIMICVYVELYCYDVQSVRNFSRVPVNFNLYAKQTSILQCTHKMS